MTLKRLGSTEKRWRLLDALAKVPWDPSLRETDCRCHRRKPARIAVSLTTDLYHALFNSRSGICRGPSRMSIELASLTLKLSGVVEKRSFIRRTRCFEAGRPVLFMRLKQPRPITENRRADSSSLKKNALTLTSRRFRFAAQTGYGQAWNRTQLQVRSGRVRTSSSRQCRVHDVSGPENAKTAALDAGVQFRNAEAPCHCTLIAVTSSSLPRGPFR